MGIFRRDKNINPKNTKPKTVKHSAVTGENSSSYWVDGEITFPKLIEAYHRDLYLHGIVNINADYVMNNSFRLIGNEDTDDGRMALELIKKFAEDQDLDALLYRCCKTAFLTGNFFLKYKGDKLIELPISTFYKIVTDEDNQVTHYTRYTGRTQNNTDIIPNYTYITNKTEDIPASEIIHFRFGTFDQSVFGEGVGHAFLREGWPYQDSKGNNHRRPPLAAINSMVLHSLAVGVYAGQPRYLVNANLTTKDQVKSVQNQMEKLDPLQHLISNAGLDVKEISLTANQKNQHVFNRLENAAIHAGLNPTLRLWSDENLVSYASSKEIMESFVPVIQIMTRAIKAFFEKEIFMPLIKQHFPNVPYEDLKVNLVFGEDDPHDISAIGQLVDILIKTDRLQDHADDILELLRDANFSLSYQDASIRNNLREVSRKEKRQKQSMTKAKKQINPLEEMFKPKGHRVIK